MRKTIEEFKQIVKPITDAILKSEIKHIHIERGSWSQLITDLNVGDFKVRISYNNVCVDVYIDYKDLQVEHIELDTKDERNVSDIFSKSIRELEYSIKKQWEDLKSK